MRLSITEDKLDNILEAHREWLKDNSTGKRANLSNLDLRSMYLQGKDLTSVIIVNSDLSHANMSYINLTNAEVSNCDLYRTNLLRSNMAGIDLCESRLSYACLSYADLTKADLSHITFTDADLYKTNLTGVSLYKTIGNGLEIKSLQVCDYSVAWTKESLQIGCERYSFDEWWGFSDEDIRGMAENRDEAIILWKTWKPILKMLIDQDFVKN